MHNYYYVAIAALVVAILAVILVLRGRGSAGQPSAAAPATAPAVQREAHHESIADAAAVATADIAGQFLGVDTTPGPPDDLTRLKGLGPKASGVLNGIGVTTYAQLAALTPGQIAKVDAAMGNLAGRIHRDQWVDQAKLLASGDIPGFEARFGKLGE